MEEKEKVTAEETTEEVSENVGDGVLDVPSAVRRRFGTSGKICPSRSNFPDGSSGTPTPTKVAECFSAILRYRRGDT